jgi:N-acetylmuramoyl-L-alanine amidase
MAPISGLFEPMGAIAAFYEADRSVVVTNRVGVLLRLRLNETAALVNGRSRILPVPPALIGQHIFVPAQAVFSALGAWTKFEESENTLYVSSQITSISAQTAGGVLQVKVDATGPIQVETNVLTNPDRLVVDFLNSALRTDAREYPVNGAGVMRIRTAQFQIKPYVSRMVFDLNEAVEIRVTAVPTSFSLTLEVRPRSAVTPAQPPDTTPPSVGPPDVREPQPSPVPPGVLKIMGVTFQASGTVGRLVIEGSGTMQYKIREFVFPDRLAIDVQDAVFIPVKQEIAVDGPSIAMIRAAQFTAEPPVTRVVVTLRRKMNYVISQAEGQLILEIAGTDARGHVVAIDPGHGGRDPGAIGPTGLREADVVLDIALRVRDMLTRDGVRVVMLRESDVTVELLDRPRVAREKGVTIFVSIHANASPRASVNGTETYYLTPQSLALAQMIQDELAIMLGIASRGIKTASFLVLRDSGVPTVLVETAFISHADGEAQLRDPGFRQRIAEAVYRGIARFLAIYPVPVAP